MNFNPGTGADAAVRSLALQSDNNVVLAGDFTTINSALRPKIARLSTNSPSAFATWTAGFGLTGPSAAATADPDSDGLANAVEFIVGGNPVTSSGSESRMPAATISGGNLIFTFFRDDASEAPGVTLTVESGTDLTTWPESFVIGATTAASSAGVNIAENGTAADMITISIPICSEPSEFARLKVAIAP
jgi:hypothetical protein